MLYIQMEFCPRTLKKILVAGPIEEADAWQVISRIQLMTINGNVSYCTPKCRHSGAIAAEKTVCYQGSCSRHR